MAKQRFTIVFQEIHKRITEDVWAKDIEQAIEMAEAMIPEIAAKYYLNKDFARVAEIRARVK